MTKTMTERLLIAEQAYRHNAEVGACSPSVQSLLTVADLLMEAAADIAVLEQGRRDRDNTLERKDAEIERLQRLLDARPPYYCRNCHCANCGNTLPANEPSEQLSAPSGAGRSTSAPSNEGAGPATVGAVHTTEDNFRHFLSYSKLSAQPAAELHHLRLAYYAGADKGPPKQAAMARCTCPLAGGYDSSCAHHGIAVKSGGGQ